MTAYTLNVTVRYLLARVYVQSVNMCFGVSLLFQRCAFGCSCSQSPSTLSWAEEPQLVLISSELSFLFITVTLTSFLFINVTLAADLNLLISKVDGNHSSVCVQIATHQQSL